MRVDHRLRPRLLEDLVDAGQGSKRIHAQPPSGNGGKERMNRATGA
jgi:hypothetical protein